MSNQKQMKRRSNRFCTFFTNETIVMSVITIYSIVLFIDGFPQIHNFFPGIGSLFFTSEYICTVYFVFEALCKIYVYGFKSYIKEPWNKFDLLIVIVSLPSLLSPFIAVVAMSNILALRIARLARLFKLLRFIPNGPKIWEGIQRALRASVGVIFALLMMNLLLAMGASILFGEEAPEYFGNPLISLYSMFKVFTIEGWFEIPDAISQKAGTASWGFFVRSYFVFAVLVGGILGLSLANAVFVDEMTADNTDNVEKMVAKLERDLQNFKSEAFEMQAKMLTDLQTELQTLRASIEMRDSS